MFGLRPLHISLFFSSGWLVWVSSSLISSYTHSDSCLLSSLIRNMSGFRNSICFWLKFFLTFKFFYLLDTLLNVFTWLTYWALESKLNESWLPFFFFAINWSIVLMACLNCSAIYVSMCNIAISRPRNTPSAGSLRLRTTILRNYLCSVIFFSRRENWKLCCSLT
jgi:hypothetical protein